MKSKDLMTKNVISQTTNNTIFDICTIMTNEKIGFVPILENNTLVGVITDRDIIERVISKNIDIFSKVTDFMSSSVIYSFEDDDISETITKMADYQIKRIVILNKNHLLVGLISLKDIALNNYTNKYVNDLLKEISQTTINPISYINVCDKNPV